MRTSFHHQPEAQHPIFQLSTSWQADYPIFRSKSGHAPVIAEVNPAASFQRQLVCQLGVVTASCSWVGSAWLTVMCDAGSRTSRWMDRLNEFLSVAVARDAMLPGRKTG